jgi:hypothetical protein
MIFAHADYHSVYCKVHAVVVIRNGIIGSFPNGAQAKWPRRCSLSRRVFIDTPAVIAKGYEHTREHGL